MKKNCAPPLLIDWVLTNHCNYNCSYCVQKEYTGQRMEQAAPRKVDALIKAIGTLDRKCVVSMTGGEPTIHPDFAEICSRLSKCGAYIELLSNLSGMAGKWEEIIKNSDGRLLNVVAAFHPDHADPAEFAANYRLLSSAKISVEVIVVADNTRFDRIKGIIDSFIAKGIPAKPTVMMGKDAFVKYSAEYSAWISSFYDAPGARSRTSLTGGKCPAGKDYIRLKPGGRMWMCASASYYYLNGPAGCLGNIETEGFSRLFGEALTCQYKFCLCPVPTGLNSRVDETNK